MRANQLTSRVEISVSCKGLRDKDVMSKSDPMAVFFTKMGPQQNFREVARSEVIKNSLNPDFSRKFEMDYFFEIQQRIKIEIYDHDSASNLLEAHDFLGGFECSLGELVSRRKVETKLVGRLVSGSITVSCLELSACKEAASILIRGCHLDKKDMFGKSDPYLEIFRCDQENVSLADASAGKVMKQQFSLVHRTEYIKNTLNPEWKSILLPLVRLCYGDKDRPLRFDCYDWDSDGGHDFIGSCFTTVNQIVQRISQSQATFQLINEEKRRRKKGYKDSGEILFQRFGFEIQHTFLDYISGGTQLNFAVAVDFTASNGAVNNPNSLHYIDPYNRRPNQYETAIQAVGTIIQDYDYDRMFPGLGFGALIPPRKERSHCFPLTFQLNNPYCQGVPGLLQAYQQAIRMVELYGPTNFTPVIDHVLNMARSSVNGSQYFVLLIITDGIITDMDQTINKIVDASGFPMSIIIIGVGNEDFSSMNALDCDQGRLRSGSKVAERDIVQFVALRDFMNKGDANVCQAALAQEVLAELPEQVVQWMRRRGIQPLPRTQALPAFQGNQEPIPYQDLAKMNLQPQGPPGVPPYGQGAAPGYPQGPPYGQGSPAHAASPYPQGPPGYPTGPGQGYPSGPPGPGQGYPSGPPGPGQGYPTGPPGPGQGYPSGPPGPGQGYPTGQPGPGQGYPTGPPGPGQGYPTGQPGPGQGYPTGPPGPGYPSGPPAPGYPSGPPAPGYPSGPPAPGYPAEPPAPGYPSGPPGPGYPSGPQSYGQGAPPYAQAPPGQPYPQGPGGAPPSYGQASHPQNASNPSAPSAPPP